MKTAAPTKSRYAVTRAAVVARINRHLAKSDELLRKNRRYPSGTEREWYLVSRSRNYILDYVDDLEAYAREVGVLKPWEALADADDLADRKTKGGRA